MLLILQRKQRKSRIRNDRSKLTKLKMQHLQLLIPCFPFYYNWQVYFDARNYLIFSTSSVLIVIIPMLGTCTVIKVISEIFCSDITIPYLPDLNLTIDPIHSCVAKTKTPVCFPDSLCRKMTLSRLDVF